MAELLECKYLPVEIKEVREDGTFTGLASKYGEEDLGGDVIDKGAFTKTLSENPTVPILWQHQAGEVIGTGNVKEWGSKITVEARLDMEDPAAMKAYRKMKGGLIKGLSIGFTTIKSIWEDIEGRSVRHISELKLWEVSIVTFPMLPAAQVTRVKSAEENDIQARLVRVEQALQAKQQEAVVEEKVPDQRIAERKQVEDFVMEAREDLRHA